MFLKTQDYKTLSDNATLNTVVNQKLLFSNSFLSKSYNMHRFTAEVTMGSPSKMHLQSAKMIPSTSSFKNIFQKAPRFDLCFFLGSTGNHRVALPPPGTTRITPHRT